MNTKEAFLMVLALIWVALLFFLVMHWIKPASEPPVEVLVATTEISPTQAISDKNVHWERIPASQVQPDDIKNGPKVLASYTGRYPIITIRAKQIVKRNFFPVSQAAHLATLINPGMYAMTVELGKNNDDNMFITPGDKVDVLITRIRKNSKEQNESITQLLLANVRVLAVNDLMLGGVPTLLSKPQPQAQKTLTLEVSSDEAARLALGGATGLLSFSLHTESGVATSLESKPFSSRLLDPPPKRPIVEYRGEKMILRAPFTENF